MLRNPRQKLLTDIFGPLEIVDAKQLLSLFPKKADFTEGTPGDPSDCGFKRCGARQVGATAMLVFRKFTYVDHVGEDGVRRVHRYRNSSHVESVAHAYDEGKPIDVSRQFVLLPPCKSVTLARQRERSHKMRHGPAGKLILAAWHANAKVRTAEADMEKWTRKFRQLSDRQSPAAASVVEARTQMERLKQRLPSLREDAATKSALADEVRGRPARNHYHNNSFLDARNGTGAFARRQHGRAAHLSQ